MHPCPPSVSPVLPPSLPFPPSLPLPPSLSLFLSILPLSHTPQTCCRSRVWGSTHACGARGWVFVHVGEQFAGEAHVEERLREQDAVTRHVFCYNSPQFPFALSRLSLFPVISPSSTQEAGRAAQRVAGHKQTSHMPDRAFA